MNDYRNAYENYYRNLNKHSELINNKKVSRHSDKLRKISRSNNKDEINIKNILIRQVSGACIVLVSYTLLKYIPLDSTQYIYGKSKELINSNVTYNESIEAIKKINIGEYSISDVNINGVTIDDLKEKPLKEKLSKCFEYIQNQRYDEEKHI